MDSNSQPPSFTVANLQNLNNAIAMGVKEVTYGDKKTVYQDINQMMQLRNLMITEIYGTASFDDRRNMGIFKSTLYNGRS